MAVPPALRAASWTGDDPLRYVLLATCGAYPAEAKTGRDYSQLFQKALAARTATLGTGDAIPNDLYRHLTPNGLTAIELEPVSTTEKEKPSEDAENVSLTIEETVAEEPVVETGTVQNIEAMEDYDPTLELSSYKFPDLDLLDEHGKDKIIRRPPGRAVTG